MDCRQHENAIEQEQGTASAHLLLVYIGIRLGLPFKQMKITLSLQPGNKLALPLELPDDVFPTMTVRDLKGLIMEMNASKDASHLHCIHKQKILDDGDLLTSYELSDGDVVKYLFAEERKGTMESENTEAKQ